jgi:hypothetical protein
MRLQIFCYWTTNFVVRTAEVERLQNFVIGTTSFVNETTDFCYWTTNFVIRATNILLWDYKTENLSRGMIWGGQGVHLSHSSPHGQHVLLWGPQGFCCGDYKICHKDHTYFVYWDCKTENLSRAWFEGQGLHLNHSSPMVQHVLLWSPYKDFVMGLQNLMSKKC